MNESERERNDFWMKVAAFVAAVSVVVAMVLAPRAETLEPRLTATTIGVLGSAPKNGMFTVRDADGVLWRLALDNKSKVYPGLLKSLPGWVGKRVKVAHRPGEFDIGPLRCLLTNDVTLEGKP